MIDPKLRFNLTAIKDKTFVDFSNQELLSENVKNLYTESENLNFIVKGVSKKSESYKNALKTFREKNYDGKWYESGWYEAGKEKRNLIDFYYSSKVDKGQSWFYQRDKLPYTTSTSTGVYYNVVWSGLKDYNFPTGGGPDALSNLVLGGFMSTNYDRETFVFPYRNFNEFFDHEFIQVGDMGHKMFYDKVNALKPENAISYNRIFFTDGLNRDSINENTKMIILSHASDGLPFAARGVNIETTGTLNNRKWFQRFETPDKPRFDIFFYKEDLELTYTNKKEQSFFGYGPKIQLNNPKYGLLANENFSLNLSGIYPETLSSTICFFNTGLATEEFYLNTSNDTLFNIVDPLNTKVLNTDPKMKKYIWTNEENSTSGEFIKSYKLGKNASSNFEIKVLTEHLTGFLNQKKIEYINVYRITGEKNIQNTNFLGALSQKFTVPVNIKSIDNGTKIFYSGFLEKTGTLEDYQHLGFRSFTFDQSQIKDKQNNLYAINFYSTGQNIKSIEVMNDLTGRINNQDIKHVYPIQSGEAYLLAKTNSAWINLKNNEKRIFKWIQDNDKSYSNSLEGNLKCNFEFEIDTKKMLPNFSNLSGSNYTVKMINNNLLFNNSQESPKLFKNKNYRFLFTNFSNNNFSIFNLDYGEMKVYEPEYNKTFLNNFKLITLRLEKEQYRNLFWSGLINNNSVTGEFKIVHNQNINPYHLSNENSEYLIYNIAPKGKTDINDFIPGYNQLNQTINSSFYTEKKLNEASVINFYPYISNKIKILHSKDDINNPCLQKDNYLNNNFWHIATQTNDGAISGCYSNQEFLKMLDLQSSTKKINPQIVLTTGKYYHFVRSASTQKEIDSTELKFFTLDPTQSPPIFSSGLDQITITRDTHLTNPDYLKETFQDFKTKYFDHIYFYVPPTINRNNRYYYGKKYAIDGGVGTPLSYINIQDVSNDTYSRQDYLEKTKPIFSGNLNFITSDVKKENINIKLILSGEGTYDYVNF